MRTDPTRRVFLLGTSAGIAGLAGCIGSGGGGGAADTDDTEATTAESAGTATSGGSSGGAITGAATQTGSGGATGDESYEVGYGDSQTTVDAADFPEKLNVYAVQSGWMNWPAVWQAFDEKYGVTLKDDDRSSGDALKHARAHAQNPTYSAYNGGYITGLIAHEDGLTQAYKPANWDKVPTEFKTDDGHVTATRRVTTAVTYRPDVYEERGLDAPKTWEDIAQPKVAQDLALQTPDAAVGLAGALSINNAKGGSLDDVQPVIDYYNRIKEAGATFTDNFLSQFTKGEFSTFVRYDYSGLDLKYNDDALAEENVDIAILKGENGNPGAINFPYGYAFLKGAPNPGACKLFMDFVLSLEGQKLFTEAFVRPIRADELDMPGEFPPQSAYEDTQFQVDYPTLLETRESISEEIVRGASL
jgi:putative spermidine/putrescine transport system substrate-binding protein